LPAASVQPFAVARELDELIHFAVVESLLFRFVIVILIAGRGLRAAEAKRVRGVRIIRQERAACRSRKAYSGAH
jgi:hypothetical protein